MVDYIDTLNKICVQNYDNGKTFIDSSRLNVIHDLLEKSEYKLINKDGLFNLYGKRDILKDDEIVIVSSHVDCHHNITSCFSSSSTTTNSNLLGTYDNAITNAVAVNIMLDKQLPDNIFFAFTGDEEFNSNGATNLITYLNALDVNYKCIVLDVTDVGWDENFDFTIENNFFDDEFGRRLIEFIKSTSNQWCLVPSYLDDLPYYIDKKMIFDEEAEEDESWTYDEHDIECFSLCLPCFGEMHSNDGIEVRKNSYLNYIYILSKLLRCFNWRKNI